MVPRGEFRHHAAIGAVQINLTVERMRQEAPAGIKNGDTGLVAGGFQAEYLHQFSPKKG